jgi:hypothetical protein
VDEYIEESGITADDYKLQPESILKDKGLPKKNMSGSFTNSANNTTPIHDPMKEFIGDPKYKADLESIRQNKEQAANGGFKYEDGGIKKFEDGGFDPSSLNDSDLTITSPKGDPWEYSKLKDGSMITRRKSNNGSVGQWIQPKTGSKAATAIQTSVFNEAPTEPVRTVIAPTSENQAAVNRVETPNNPDGNNIINATYNQTTATVQMQEMLLDNNYDLGPTGADGDFGPKTTTAFMDYSDKNLSNLPFYQNRGNLRCSEGGCSQQTTDMISSLFPTVDRGDLGPEDSWYRAHHIIETGGKLLWKVDDETVKGGDIDEIPAIPPVETWSDFRVGDVVTLNRKGDVDSNGNRITSKESKLYGQDANRGTEHTGFIVGRDPDSGVPLVMHGWSGMMFTNRIDGQPMKSGGGDSDVLKYKVDAVLRPKGLLNKEIQTKDSYFYNPNNQKLDFNVEYVENLPEDEQAYAQKFLEVSDNINLFGSISGASSERVVNAQRVAYGIFKNETGTEDGVRMGGFKTWVKNTFDPEFIADARTTLKNLQSSPYQAKPEAVAADYSEPSVSPARIKFNMNTEDGDGNLTQLGKWYEAANITKENIQEGNNWVTGEVGDTSLEKSFQALTFAVLHNENALKKHPEYNPDTNEVGGVPFNYVLATMHKSPNLAGLVYDGKSVLDILKEGDREYANAVIKHGENITVVDSQTEASNKETYAAEDFIEQKKKQKEKTTSRLNFDVAEEMMSLTTKKALYQASGNEAEWEIQMEILKLKDKSSIMTTDDYLREKAIKNITKRKNR